MVLESQSLDEFKLIQFNDENSLNAISANDWKQLKIEIEEFEESTAVINTIQNIRYMDYFKANQQGNWILDARVSYEINKKHKVGLISSNLLNNIYSLRPLKIEQLRTVMLQYTLKL